MGATLAPFRAHVPSITRGLGSHPAARLAEPLNHCLLVGCPPKPSFRGLAWPANPVSARWQPHQRAPAVLSSSTPAEHSSGWRGRQEPPLRPPQSVSQCLGSHFRAERQAHRALPLTPPGKVREPAAAKRTPRPRDEAGRHTQRAQDPEERLKLERRSPWAQATWEIQRSIQACGGSSSLQLGPDCGVLGQD